MSCAGSRDPASGGNADVVQGQQIVFVRHSDTRMQRTFFRLMRPVAYASISNLIKMLVGLFFFPFLIQHKPGLGFILFCLMLH